MVDKLTPEQRRRCMQHNKSKGTQPELMLSHELWHRGIRYRRNVRSVPGSPDICFKALKVAVFVDGDFWHGRDWEHTQHRIQSNRDFWFAKIQRNMERDRRVDDRLNKMGWQVIRIWEGDVRKSPSASADLVEAALRQRQLQHLHRIYSFDTQYEYNYAAEPDED